MKTNGISLQNKAKNIEIYLSDNAKKWQSAEVNTRLDATHAQENIYLNHAISARFVKVVFLNTFGNGMSVELSRFNVFVKSV